MKYATPKQNKNMEMTDDWDDLLAPLPTLTATTDKSERTEVNVNAFFY